MKEASLLYKMTLQISLQKWTTEKEELEYDLWAFLINQENDYKKIQATQVRLIHVSAYINVAKSRL